MRLPQLSGRTGVLVLVVAWVLMSSGANAMTARADGHGCGAARLPSPQGLVQVTMPPVPDLAARAVSATAVRVSWRFRSWPRACRPVMILVAVQPRKSGDTPWVDKVVHPSPNGSHVVHFQPFWARGETATVAVHTAKGVSGPTIRVPIRG